MSKRGHDSFDARRTLEFGTKTIHYYALKALVDAGYHHVDRLPFSLKVLLENLLRGENGQAVTRDDVETLAQWRFDGGKHEIAFTVARVLLQDFTGVPAVVDLAAMRDAMVRLGGDPGAINPLQPVDLVIDHSVQVDYFGSPDATAKNVAREFERNHERYQFLRWAQGAFADFRVVPPGAGIVHQVNLEYLARVVFENDGLAYPDTLVGTDSHTPMVNSLGVVGWGVGGIEAEAAMLGQPIAMLIPDVVGVRLNGKLKEGTTATDLVLRVVEMLRKHGVVGKFVEFFGTGLSSLALADRATISNMAPEYGATVGFFPVDARTLEYLTLTGRTDEEIALVEAYCKAQGLFRTADTPDPEFSATLELDLGSIEPAIAGPKRPQDRILLSEAKAGWHRSLRDLLAIQGRLEDNDEPVPESFIEEESVPVEKEDFDVRHGSVVIAAITSCTNTSNPAVLVAAGLLAQNAIERGLDVKPWVKTSFAPGSRVVSHYLEAAGLMTYLERLKFHVVGYGCTTCIGNSGPLPPAIRDAVHAKDLVACSVLSGNRNFEGRIGPDVRANYLASPPLVVAYALAGTMDIDIENEPLGVSSEGEDVYLRDIWPTKSQIDAAITASVRSDMFREEYASVFDGTSHWKELPEPEGKAQTYAWDGSSTYVLEPPFFEDMTLDVPPIVEIRGARCIALLGESITTDHISPASAIPKDGDAGRYLSERGVEPRAFNSFGSRRGNHEVMMRGTFANIRLRNQLAPGTEGGWTTHWPTEEVVTIFEASRRYRDAGTPLVVLAGAEYGTGSSRDWAAKGTILLGIKAVIAAGYERIHRSNLIGMGVLPLQFEEGQTHQSLGLTGRETFDILGLGDDLTPGQKVRVATSGEGSAIEFEAIVRIDTPMEAEYYRHGGILHRVLRDLASP